MQTTPLPGLNAGPAPSVAPQAAAGSDGAQFGATLSREIDQRGAATQQQAASDAGKAQQSQAPQQPPAPDAKARQGAKADDGKPAGATQAGDDKDDDDKSTDAATAAAAAPANDMLAMVASVAQLLQGQGAIAPSAAPAADGKTDGKAGVAAAASAQLAGLGAAGAGADADAAIPLDAAARFAALMRGGQGAQPTAAPGAARADANARADIKPSTRGAGLAANTPAASHAPSAAPSEAPGSAPSLSPSAAPTSAPAALAAQLAAAVPQDSKATPDQAAAQLLAAAQAQQAAPASAQVQAQAVALENHIPAQLGTPAWDNQVGQKVVWMVAGGEQSASLTLNPPDLGPLQVVLNVSGDQASVAFSSSHQDVRHALESALPRLREMMGESGIALGSATVGTGMPDQRQAQDNWQGSGQSGARSNGGTVAAADDSPAPRVATRTTVLGDRGMVDTFA